MMYLIPQKMLEPVGHGECLINLFPNLGSPQPVVAPGEPGSKVTKINQAHTIIKLLKFLNSMLSVYCVPPIFSWDCIMQLKSLVTRDDNP